MSRIWHLPKSVESSYLSVNKAVIWCMLVVTGHFGRMAMSNGSKKSNSGSTAECRLRSSRFMFLATILVAGSAAALRLVPVPPAEALETLPQPPPGAVLTWHNDNFRTGWQQQETFLASSHFPSNFGMLHQVAPT